MIGTYVLNKIISGEQIDFAELKKQIFFNDPESLRFWANDILMIARQYVLQSYSFTTVIGTSIKFDSNDVEKLIEVATKCRDVLKTAEEVAEKVLSFNEWKDIW